MLTTARQNLEDMKNHLEKSMKLMDFFISGARDALLAMQRGDDPDAAFPLLTRAGIMAMPMMLAADGKLSPYLPADFTEKEEGDHS